MATAILATVKQHLRYSGTSEDTLIGTYIDAAFAQIEHRTGLQLLTATFEAEFDCFPRYDSCPLYLYGTPLQSMQSIAYEDSDGFTCTWDDTEYEVLIRSTPGRLRPKQGYSWPAVSRNILAKYTAGYGSTWSTLPFTAQHAVLLLTEHYFDQRSPTIIGTTVTPIPEGIQSILTSLDVGAEFHEVA